MSLADHPPIEKKRALCGVAKLNLPAEDLDVLESWFEQDPKPSDTSVAESITKYTGRDISGQVVARHRARKCSCFR